MGKQLCVRERQQSHISNKHDNKHGQFCIGAIEIEATLLKKWSAFRLADKNVSFSDCVRILAPSHSGRAHNTHTLNNCRHRLDCSRHILGICPRQTVSESSSFHRRVPTEYTVNVFLPFASGNLLPIADAGRIEYKQTVCVGLGWQTRQD